MLFLLKETESKMDHVSYRAVRCKLNFPQVKDFNRIIIIMVSTLILASSVCLSAEEGPVMWLRAAGDSKKEIIEDLSGNNNNGVLHGAQLVDDALCGKALEFDGVDDYVDCGTSKLFNVNKGLTMEVWVKPSGEQASGLPGIIGKSYSTYAMIYGDAGGMFKFQTGGNQIRLPLQPDVWQHICCVYGDSDITVYVNGKEVGRLQKKQQLISQNPTIPLRLGKIEGKFVYTQDAFFKGRIAMARIYDRALTSKEVDDNFDSSSVSVFNKALFDIAAYCWVPDNQIIIKISPLKQLEHLKDTTISITVEDNELKSVKEYTQNINLVSAVTLNLENIKPGNYNITAIARNVEGGRLAPPVKTTLKWPEVADTETPGKRLNNFVRQLAAGDVQNEKLYQFSNPREGWIYIAVSSGTSPQVILKGVNINETYELEDIQGGLHETMRYLSAGDYNVSFKGAKGTFAVHTIPFIIMTEYHDDRPYVNMSKKEELEFRDVHNTVQGNFARHYQKVGMDTEKPNSVALKRMAEWTKRGRFNVTNSPIPGESKRAMPGKNVPPVEESFEYWSNAYAMKHQNGIMMDEFGYAEREEYKHWAAAIRRISENNVGNINRKVFAYCIKNWHSNKKASDLHRAIIDSGFFFAPEIYIEEKPSEAEAKIECLTQLVDMLYRWKRDSFFPLRQIVVTLSNCTGIICSNDRYPWVDYKVFYEMQIRSLALDPRLDGLGGITAWVNTYADEETLRWMGKLYRHYCIEGKTSPLYMNNGYSYNLDYVRNSEFMEEFKHWKIIPAQKGSIYLQEILWYGANRGTHNNFFVQGPGDTFAVMRTFANKPNELRQEIKRLIPGKTYCARIISGDFTALKNNDVKNKILPVSITIEGGELIPGKCNLTSILAGRGVSMPLPIMAKKTLVNYHMVVFRALQPEADLVITDRFKDGTTDLKEGDEVMVNFIEVQPYFEK